MIALEVSSAAGPPPWGGVGGAIRQLVGALLRIDPGTRYLLCHRLSRWRKGEPFRPPAGNARVRWIQDPWNRLLVGRPWLFHSMGVFVPRTPRVPKLVTIHDLNPIRNPQWVRPDWRERRGARIRDAAARADRIVTYSRFIAREIAEVLAVAPERIHTVPLGIDTQAYRPLPPERITALRSRYGDYVIAIGIQSRRKNFETLIEAVAGLPGLRLVHVGTPSDGAEAFARALERSRLGERFVHFERLPHGELVELLGAARAHAVPSLYEGFGLTVLEAMACGTPVVCSRAASLPEVGGDAALYVDATDTKAVREALARVLEDAALATRLREAGLARARVCSWERSAHELRALYRRVAGR